VSNAVDIGRTADDDVLFIAGATQINLDECVSWSNSDSEAHQPAPVGEPADTWFAEPVASGTVSAAITFDTAGTVAYACALHPKEKGSIIVPHTVTIAASGGTASFDPQTQTVNAGDSVVWQNNDTQTHQPEPDSGTPWFTKPIAAGATSSAIAFSTAGSVPYHCKLHPSETGTIEVS
jgi:plastocyanin